METVDVKALYLDLMKRCLLGLLVEDPPFAVFTGSTIDFSRRVFDPDVRARGRDWPSQAHSMIGLPRMDNIQYCVESVLADRIPGDLMEAGVWRGGASMFMRAILKVYGVNNRTVWAADSFRGFPPPDHQAYPADGEGDPTMINRLIGVSLAEVRKTFARYGLLDEQVRFLAGWFRDTLPLAPVRELAVLRLDGDMYESTMDGLTHLYPKLSPGGYLIVDDYLSLTPCAQAVDDYRRSHGIQEKILHIDWNGAYWRKTR